MSDPALEIPQELQEPTLRNAVAAIDRACAEESQAFTDFTLGKAADLIENTPGHAGKKTFYLARRFNEAGAQHEAFSLAHHVFYEVAADQIRRSGKDPIKEFDAVDTLNYELFNESCFKGFEELAEQTLNKMVSVAGHYGLGQNFSAMCLWVPYWSRNEHGSKIASATMAIGLVPNDIDFPPVQAPDGSRNKDYFDLLVKHAAMGNHAMHSLKALAQSLESPTIEQAL